MAIYDLEIDDLKIEWDISAMVSKALTSTKKDNEEEEEETDNGEDNG